MCVDCHEPHEAQAGTHTVGSSTAAPALRGCTRPCTGVQHHGFLGRADELCCHAARPGKSYEAYLCINVTAHRSPVGRRWPRLRVRQAGYKETDVALEFNPNKPVWPQCAGAELGWAHLVDDGHSWAIHGGHPPQR